MSNLKRTLGSTGDSATKREVKALIRDLQDVEKEAAARKRLVEIGQPAVGPVTEALGSDIEEVTKLAAFVLGVIGDRTAVGPLAAALKRREWKTKTPTEVGARLVIAGALGRIGGPEAADALAGALHDPDQGVRCFSAYGLGNLGDGRAVEPLVALLSSPRDKTVAAAALAKMGEAAIDPLIAVCRGGNEELAMDAALMLGVVGGPDALLPLIRDKSKATPFAVVALGRIGSEAIPSLIEEFRSPDEEVRVYAGLALAAIGQESVPPLISALQEEDLRPWAGGALRLLGETAVDPLISALEDSDSDVRETAMWALVKIGEPSVAHLKTVARERSGPVRDLASEALVRMENREEDMVDRLLAKVQSEIEQARR